MVTAIDDGADVADSGDLANSGNVADSADLTESAELPAPLEMAVMAWRAAPDRSGFSRRDVTGPLGRALVFSVAGHALLAGLMGVPGAGDMPPARAARPASLPASLHLRLDLPGRATSGTSAQLVAPLVHASDVSAAPESNARPQAAAQASHTGNASEPPTAPRVIAPAGPIQAPVAARYYLPREVDQPAAPLQHAQLWYPEAALKQRIGGVVVMHLFIGTDGSIERTEVVRSEPPGVFDQAVRDAAQASRFRPALLGHSPVNSRVTIEVPFDPDCSDFMTCGPPAAQR